MRKPRQKLLFSGKTRDGSKTMKAGYLSCTETIKRNATPSCCREALQSLPASFESTREFFDRFRGFSGRPSGSFRWRGDRCPPLREFVALGPLEHKAMKLHLLT